MRCYGIINTFVLHAACGRGNPVIAEMALFIVQTCSYALAGDVYADLSVR